MTKTGIKAPHGTGRVVAKADIQNCTKDNRNTHLNINKTIFVIFHQNLIACSTPATTSLLI